MTKKTIMELLRETDKKEEIKGGYYMDRLFGHAMNNANDLHFESIEQHVAVHTLDALERIANALEKESGEDSGGQTLTYHEFFEEFNAVSQGYHACSDLDEVVILDQEGNLKASLNLYVWSFRASGFDSGELALMEKLAATSPELRGEIDDD